MPEAPREAATEKPRKIEAAFFDVDNTLVRGATTFLFGKVALDSGAIKRWELWRFAWHQFIFIWRGERNRNLHDLRDRVLELSEGHTAQQMLEILDQLWDKELKYRLWPETVAEVKRHLAEGREVWLLTASPKELGELIAQRLGATGALGTIVEVKDGVLTGALVGKPLHGIVKRKAAKALAKERRISLKRSWAYSDSQNDLPLLTAVGNPVAVNPDKVLKRHAKAANWPIMEFKRSDLKQNQVN